MAENPNRSWLRPIGIASAVVAAVGAVFAISLLPQRPRVADVPPAELAQQIHDVCAACHKYPPPESFPRSSWKKEVEQGYRFAIKSDRNFLLPPIEQVIRYYESQAPAELPLPEI